MKQASRILQDITAKSFKKRNYSDQIRIFNDFAEAFGWSPSDYLEPGYALAEVSNGHLIVEHGLEHSVVISFIAEPAYSRALPIVDARVLMGVSYNSLIDIHMTIDEESVCIYLNRSDPLRGEVSTFNGSDLRQLDAANFREMVGRLPAATMPALDSVLVDTIDYWKRYLYSELKCAKKNEALSALFNAIIFVRAVEDHYRLRYGAPNVTLLERWRSNGQDGSSLPQFLLAALRAYRAGRGASSLLTMDRLDAFAGLSGETVGYLLADFYRARHTPYTYNFALMSRHALSRIYEKYVGLLREEGPLKSKQQTLFLMDLPETDPNKAAGAVYTPQFIPRFFCRFVQDQVPRAVFRRFRVADPACGSGIFLRTFLEKKVEDGSLTTDDIKASFKGLLGIDIDENACQASRLSLALFHLMRTDALPATSDLAIVCDEALRYYKDHPEVEQTFDAVIGNPPFVRLELQTQALQDRIRGFLADLGGGRPDLYLAILRLCMNMVEPGGFLCIVLPHSFLINEAAQGLRTELRDQFWLRCVVDLSAIPIFEGFGTYIVLLIAQRKAAAGQTAPSCRVVLCQDFVGRALQDCLDIRTVRTPYYSIFDVEQGYFSEEPWTLLGPEDVSLARRLKSLPRLEEFLLVQQGLNTGDDSVYIRSPDQVPRDERHLYAPLLRDRQIERYTVPKKASRYVYYPYANGHRVPEEDLKRAKATWAHLTKCRDNLKKTASKSWPYLVRAREKYMARSKIVTPHLVLSPRFALDAKGVYAVSRSPFLVSREEKRDLEFMKFFTAILNSSIVHWYLGAHAYRFSGGYVELETNYLRRIPVPDPAKVPPVLFADIVKGVDKRIATSDATIEKEIDALVLEAYGITVAECKVLGVEAKSNV